MVTLTADQAGTEQAQGASVALPRLLRRWLELTERARALLEATPELQAQLVGARAGRRYGQGAQGRAQAAAAVWAALKADKQALEDQAAALGVDLLQLARQRAIEAQAATRPAEPAEAPPAVAVYGHLAAAALRRKETRAFQLWALLRYHDQRGAGRLPMLRVYEVADFLSPANLRNVIRKGIEAGYFWREPNGYLAYAGERRLCLALGVERVKGKAVALPVDELATADFVELGALLYDAVLSSRGEGYTNPMARGGRGDEPIGLFALTGLSRNTQKRYEQRRRIRPRTNVEDLGAYDADRLQALQDRTGAGEASPFVLRQQGGARIVRRLPNAYHGTLSIVRRGRRRLNQRLETEAGRVNDPLQRTWQSEPAGTMRRYHDKLTEAARQAAANGVTSWAWQGYDRGGRIGLYDPVSPTGAIACV